MLSFASPHASLPATATKLLTSRALPCPTPTAGDVAFTKHATALEVPTDGSKPEAWATAAKADLRLLCPNGGCKTLDEYEECNIAPAPSYAGAPAQGR